MESTTEKAINFMISELEKAKIKVTLKQSEREAIICTFTRILIGIQNLAFIMRWHAVGNCV